MNQVAHAKGEQGIRDAANQDFTFVHRRLGKVDTNLAKAMALEPSVTDKLGGNGTFSIVDDGVSKSLVIKTKEGRKFRLFVEEI